MPIRYLSRGRIDRRFDALCTGREVLLFDSRDDQSLASIGDRVRELGEAPRSMEVIVLRGPGREFVEAVAEDPILPRLLSDRAVMTLAPVSAEGEGPTLEHLPWSSEPGLELAVDELRQAEVLGIIEASGAILQHEGAHYVLPSRFHANAWVRLAEALYDPLEVERLGDWLLAFLRPTTGILTDTGSMLPLVHTLRLQAFERYGRRLPVEVLDSYPHDLDELSGAIDRLESLDCEHLLLLISVNSTGKVADMFSRAGHVDHTVAVVCDTGDKALPNAHVLAACPVQRWPVNEHGDCAVCSELQRLVIDPHSYEVRNDLKWTSVGFDFELAEAQAPFFELADRTAAISLHEAVRAADGSPRRFRDLSIQLDIAALLTDESFAEKAAARLAGHPQPDLVVIPRHRAFDALAKLATAAWPELDRKAIVDVSPWRLADELERSRYEEADEILILDDALVTGETLMLMRRSLYQLTSSARRNPSVRGFAVVLRPESRAALTDVKRTFGAQGEPAGAAATVELRLDGVECVLLPQTCSWCDEVERLERLLDRLQEGHAAAVARLEHLRASSGIDPQRIGWGDPAKQTEGSFFGTLGRLAAFAASASLTHSMVDRLQDGAGPSEIRVLDMRLRMAAFYEGPILAGIIRTAPKRALYQPGYDSIINSLVAERGTALGDDCLHEIAWGALVGKLPPEAIVEALGRREGEEAVLLRDLLRIHFPELFPE